MRQSCGILGVKLTTGKPYWRHPGAKFGHFVGDIEAESGYGDFKWVSRAMLDPFEGLNARIEATVWAQIGAKFGHLGVSGSYFLGQGWGKGLKRC